MNVVPESGIFVGTVRHRRFTPVSHAFTYSMFMPLIDLDNLSALCRDVTGFKLGKWGVAAFHHADYIDGQRDVKAACLDKVEELTGERISGKVMALCQLRYFGFYFSPVNFYFIYDVESNWRYLLAEVTNTPWKEKHYYAVPAQQSFTHDKAFHVSPFNPINQTYQWRISEPVNAVSIHLEAHSEQKAFDATLSMKRRPFSAKVLAKQLIQMPAVTVKTVIGIYWQALKLWIKGAPFYPHPGAKKE